MRFERLRAQLECERIAGCKDAEKWAGYRLCWEQVKLSRANVRALRNALREDCKDLYFKGLLSLSEAVCSTDKCLYSWATVKLYYSVFYFLRCSLAIRGYAIVRNKSLYLLRVQEGEGPIKKNTDKYRNDHVCVINVYRDLYGHSDILQSNTIDGLNPYEWLMERRHQVNYREREFHDPDCAGFLQAIAARVQSKALGKLIETYVDDADYLYCFQPDHACLALPIKRALLTRQEFSTRGIALQLSDAKMKLVRTLLTVGSKQMNKLHDLVAE